MRRFAATAVLAGAVFAAGSGRALADWDQHYNYPPVPNGYSGIVSVFGAPCNGDANANALYWTAADNGVNYAVRYHRKLGGTRSSNLYPDVRFHVMYQGYDPRIYHGIWGYNCRYISGTTKYSTHAWGIAVDINSAYEHVNHYHCHTVPSGVGTIFKGHKWSWGFSWGDCMHFQYATGY